MFIKNPIKSPFFPWLSLGFPKKPTSAAGGTPFSARSRVQTSWLSRARLRRTVLTTSWNFLGAITVSIVYMYVYIYMIMIRYTYQPNLI